MITSIRRRIKWSVVFQSLVAILQVYITDIGHRIVQKQQATEIAIH